MRDVTRDEIATDVASIGHYKSLTGGEKGCFVLCNSSSQRK